VTASWRSRGGRWREADGRPAALGGAPATQVHVLRHNGHRCGGPVVLLRLLPAEALANPAALVPLFVLTNLQITSSYFAAALVLLERGRGVLAAHLVSPLNADQPAGVPEGAGQRAASGRRGSRGVTTPQDSSCVADRSSPWLVYI
jgi:hypothetical protein